MDGASFHDKNSIVKINKNTENVSKELEYFYVVLRLFSLHNFHYWEVIFLITYSLLEVALCHHYSQMIIYTWKYVHTDVDICLRHLFCFNWLRIKQVKVDLILFDMETRWRSRQSFCVVTPHIGDKSIFLPRYILISHWGILFNSASSCASWGLPICDLPSGQDLCFLS